MESERLPIEPGVRRKQTRTTSKIERFSEEIHESIGQTGEIEKRIVRSETHQEKTTLTEIIEPNDRRAYATVTEQLPRQFRLILSGVALNDRGCAEARRMEGDYILDLVAQSASRWLWQVDFRQVCQLWRAALEATRELDGTYRLRAYFEGSINGPQWTASVDHRFAIFGSRLSLDTKSSSIPDSLAGNWPSEIDIKPLATETAGGPPYYISSEPTLSEMSLMSGASTSGSCDACDIELTGDTNGKYLMGQQVTLNVVCGPGITITDLVWTVGVGAIKNYQMVDDPPDWTGTLTLLTPADLQGNNISFYWTTPGAKTVKASFKQNGKSCTLTKTITVAFPIVDANDPTDEFGAAIPFFSPQDDDGIRLALQR